MITRLTGRINRVLDEEIRLQVGPYEYQILVPEFIRRQLQTRTGEELTLHLSEYLEGNSVGSRFIPRKLGFLHESELEFFDLFCTVDKIGAKKALKAMGRPVREIADAIQRQDSKWLTTLPGIGKSTAEQIIATLRTKVMRYALTVAATSSDLAIQESGASNPTGIDPKLLDDGYMALMALGLSPIDARDRLDQVLRNGTPIQNLDDIMKLAFKK